MRQCRLRRNKFPTRYLVSLQRTLQSHDIFPNPSFLFPSEGVLDNHDLFERPFYGALALITPLPMHAHMRVQSVRLRPQTSDARLACILYLKKPLNPHSSYSHSAHIAHPCLSLPNCIASVTCCPTHDPQSRFRPRSAAASPMRSALRSDRSSSSRLGNVRKISEEGNGECKNSPHRIRLKRLRSRLGSTSR